MTRAERADNIMRALAPRRGVATAARTVDAVSAFAVYAVRAATRVASGTLISHDSSKPLDTDDDPCALLERARKLPGRIVVIRTSDGARIAARLTAPGDRP